MSKIREYISHDQRQVWSITLVLALVAGYIFLKPYIPVTVLGLLLAFLFYPVHTYFKKKLNSNGRSVLLTTIISLLVIGIPIILIMIITASQALKLADNLANSSIAVNNESLSDGLNNLVADINQKAESLLGLKEVIKSQDVQSFLSGVLPKIAGTIANSILGVVSGIPNFFTLLIVYLFVFAAGLTYAEKLRGILEYISPFDKQTNKRYIDRMGSMAKAMLKGQMLIAFLQGLATAIALAIVGLSDYFWFFLVIFTALSFIPLGAGIVTIPLGIALLLFGNISGGLIILLNHFLFVTNIDNIRPFLVPKEAQLPAVLTLLAAFAGVAHFGFIGVVYGPIIMIALTTTIESYIAFKKKVLKAKSA